MNEGSHLDRAAERRRAGGRLARRLAALSPELLLWAMGLFCSFIGAFVLIAPHRFQTAPYQALLPQALLWGTFALVSGMAMLAVAVLRPRPLLSYAAHLLVGLTLLALTASFVRAGVASGAAIYTVLGVGTLLACLLPRDRPRAAPAGGDLFALLMGVAATVAGALITGAPGLFQQPFYGNYLRVYGLAFLLTGPLLAGAQLVVPSWRSWAVQSLGGLTWVLFGLLVSLPGQLWTGVSLYAAGGATIVGLPWVRRRLVALDPSALRAHLSLVLAIATTLSLILATAVATAQEEQLAAEQARATQDIEARSVAQDLSDYIEMNGARAATLAVFAGREPLSPGRQAQVLAISLPVYPELVALRSVASDGRIVAAAGAVALPPGAVADLAAAVRQDRHNQLTSLAVGDRSLLLLGAPILDPSGDFAGTLVAALDTRYLTRRISRQGAMVSVGDGLGRLIAAVDKVQPEERLAPLPSDWDRQVRAGKRLRRGGAVRGFARVSRLGWVVAVERPRADALAGVRRGRDLAFFLLLFVIPLTALSGIFAARRIARPLADLSSAVDAMTAGDLAAPLGASSGVTEVARLSVAFREMRDRLAERTRESERLAGELRARAEALAETDRRKDEFLAMLAHELRNPIGAIANASYLLEHFGPSDPQTTKPVAIIRRQIQHLVRMVDDLLDVSRITRGKVELRRQRLDLAEVLRQAAEASRPLADAKGQTLRLELPAETLPLDGDATRLEQVVSNLLRNAVKFTGTGGTIELAVRREGSRAVVRVRDDGIGIPAALLARVFDLFAQGEQGLDRSGAGLGIGLTLVRSLVEIHGGSVEARSEGPGQGSEFEVWLPLADD
ncbi:MAG TPA: sensor histidine kinase [Thermoanaerobaculia bacterium]|nr:sensor histidine kinase [Thermoanaerobaculia bacterium]